MVQTINNDKKLALVVVTIVFCLFITNLGYLIQNTTGVDYIIISNFCKGLIFIAMLMCWKIYLSRLNKFLFVYLFFATILVLTNFLFFGENEFFPDTLVKFLTTVLPVVIIFSVIRDYKILLNALRKISLAIAAVLFIANLLGALTTFLGIYAMGFASSMNLPTLVLIEQFVNEPLSNKLRIIVGMSIVSNLFSVAVYGSRGAFLAIVAFLVFIVFRQLSNNNIYIIIAFFSLCLVFIFYESILSTLLNYLTSQGYKSRTLNLLLNDALHDSGRLALWSQVLYEVFNRPFEIRGINADYLLIDSYVHNFFLELIYSFGLLIGGFCSIFIVMNIIRTLSKGFKDFKSRVEILTLFSFFPVCLWSGSIWNDMYFWSWFSLIFVKNYLASSVIVDRK